VACACPAAHALALLRFDSKGSAEEALSMLRAALDQRISRIAQGNSSATAAALIDAMDKHNARDPRAARCSSTTRPWTRR
jgi:branched-chain amino acid transport system substrate-binding protein